MKQRLKDLTVLMIGTGLIGVIVLVSGVIPIGASGRHWAVTRSFLDFASDRSVDFHSADIQPPNLVESDMIRLGAATYESNCRWCHGRPGLPAPVVAFNMTPNPPYFPTAALEHEPRELFYIVKHGIKFAGMPAWPTQQRDDDIWPVVAFLQALPEMSDEDYTRHAIPAAAPMGRVASDPSIGLAEHAARPQLQIGSHESGKSLSIALVAKSCAVCHGETGNGRAGQRVPVIAGQSQAYLATSLRAYKFGQRYSGIMQPIAARLTDEEIVALSKRYAADKAIAVEADQQQHNLFELGRSLANEGHQRQKIPSCVDCHGPGTNLRSSEYPQLAGQPTWFIRQQLQLLARGHRGGSQNVNLMHPIADKLSAKQMDALANYYSTIARSSGTP